MTYQKKPQKQTTYPKLLSTFEKKRKRDWVIDKASRKANLKKMAGPNKARNVKMVQRFTGKRGK